MNLCSEEHSNLQGNHTENFWHFDAETPHGLCRVHVFHCATLHSDGCDCQLWWRAVWCFGVLQRDTQSSFNMQCVRQEARSCWQRSSRVMDDLLTSELLLAMGALPCSVATFVAPHQQSNKCDHGSNVVSDHFSVTWLTVPWSSLQWSCATELWKWRGQLILPTTLHSTANFVTL